LRTSYPLLIVGSCCGTHRTFGRIVLEPDAWSGDVKVTKVGSRICRGSKVPSSGYGRVGLVFVLLLAAGTYSARSSFFMNPYHVPCCIVVRNKALM
jgi:hypothetical protein